MPENVHLRRSRILIVEDEDAIRKQLVRRLSREGYLVEEAGSVEQATAQALDRFDLIITDIRMPGASGIDLIEAAHAVPVLVMTGYASIASAVECIKRGAADYIAKPFEFDEMLLTVSRLLEHALLRRQNAALRNDLRQVYPIKGIVGACSAMQEVARRIRRVATAEVPVLILGESGTGKELVARAIHEHSARSTGPFVAVNSSAIPENLIEAELFGHEKGAFTGASSRKVGLFEAAHGGTLLLDEVGDLSPASQVRLLRVLQEGEIRPVGASNPKQVDVRVLAATHRDLPTMIGEGDFRSDLYYRLSVMDIHLPPLRERGDDIDLLTDELLRQIAARVGRSQLRVDQGVRDRLRGYSWPGNIRQMANALERAAILCDGELISRVEIDPASAPISVSTDSRLSLDDYFRQFVLDHQAELTESELARRLGISRKSLWERRHRMGIPRKK